MSYIEEYNQMQNNLRKAKNRDELQAIRTTLFPFCRKYEAVDKEGCEALQDRFYTKVDEAIKETEKTVRTATNALEALEAEAFENKEKIDCTDDLLKIMGQISPANKNDILDAAISRGVKGCRAVLEILKYPAFAQMVDQQHRQRAVEGSKTKKEIEFEEKQAEKKEKFLSQKYGAISDGFMLRNVIGKKTSQSGYFKK